MSVCANAERAALDEPEAIDDDLVFICLLFIRLLLHFGYELCVRVRDRVKLLNLLIGHLCTWLSYIEIETENRHMNRNWHGMKNNNVPHSSSVCPSSFQFFSVVKSSVRQTHEWCEEGERERKRSIVCTTEQSKSKNYLLCALRKWNERQTQEREFRAKLTIKEEIDVYLKFIDEFVNIYSTEERAKF